MSEKYTRSGKGSALIHSELDDNFIQVAQAKTGAYTCVSSDNRDTIECSGTFQVDLPVAATITAAIDTGDYEVTIKNSGSGTITIARTSTDTIDGATSIALIADEVALLKVNQAGDGYNVLSPSNTLGLTATVAELNDLAGNDVDASDFTKLSEVTSTSAELNYNDLTTLGSTQASKTVTTDANNNTISGSSTAIAGSAATGISVGSLVFPANKAIEFEVYIVGAAVGNIYLELNTDTTNANYYSKIDDIAQTNTPDTGGSVNSGGHCSVIGTIIPNSTTGQSHISLQVITFIAGAIASEFTTGIAYDTSGAITSVGLRDDAAASSFGIGSTLTVRLKN